MFKWFTKLINRNKVSKSHTEKYISPINRVNHKTQCDDYNHAPKRWSVYGVVLKKGIDHAVVHWQGWEDAGWKLIPVDDLEPFRYPRIKEIDFYHTDPDTIHNCNMLNPNKYKKCKILSFIYDYLNDELLAMIRYEDECCCWHTVSTEYLYGCDDPQFFN